MMLWMILQRDMAERGHSLESIKASIAARKPDFDAFIGTSLLIYIVLTKFWIVLCLARLTLMVS
jgi:hypothetical protein